MAYPSAYLWHNRGATLRKERVGKSRAGEVSEQRDVPARLNRGPRRSLERPLSLLSAQTARDFRRERITGLETRRGTLRSQPGNKGYPLLQEGVSRSRYKETGAPIRSPGPLGFRYALRLWSLHTLDQLIGHPGIVLHFLFFACLYVLAGHKDLRLSRVLALREDETVA
jgi:hypothetical protein